MEHRVDTYIQKFTNQEQVQMENLRELVHTLYDVEEGVSYGMPSFIWKGKILCCFAMAKKHLGYYPYSGTIVSKLTRELKGYTVTTGSVHLPKIGALPNVLIQKLLEARAQEILSTNVYSYSCPKGLGYLHIILDKNNKITKAQFHTKPTTLKPPVTIRGVLDDYFKHKKPLPENVLSNDILGTEFQKKVWNEIIKIPFGSTITYKDLANKIGDSKAVRAVGTACAKNQRALFVPCHRVQSTAGKNTGYAWGKERKDWLLKFEK